MHCHGPKSQKGDVRLDSLSLIIANETTAQSWQDVLDTLNAGNMPPEKEPQPTDAELTKVLGVLTFGLRDAKRQLSEQGKAITVRRLNRREYSNTIKHLFGFTMVIDELPEDEPAETFDTIGSQQYFSSYRFDKHLELGRRIVTDALKWGNRGRQPSRLQIDEQEVRINKHIRDGLAKRMKRWNEVVAGLEAGKTWKELDFPDGRELHY